MASRSQDLSLELYDTDKVANGYLRYYDEVFENIVTEPVRLLELGTRTGGSLRLWRDYFPSGRIAGIDIDPVPTFASEERIQVFRGDQADTRFLDSVAHQTAPAGFDVIIDDAAHIASAARTAFWHLFDHHLKPGGLYAIEDWGTGTGTIGPTVAKLRQTRTTVILNRQATSRLSPTCSEWWDS